MSEKFKAEFDTVVTRCELRNDGPLVCRGGYVIGIGRGRTYVVMDVICADGFTTTQFLTDAKSAEHVERLVGNGRKVRITIEELP